LNDIDTRNLGFPSRSGFFLSFSLTKLLTSKIFVRFFLSFFLFSLLFIFLFYLQAGPSTTNSASLAHMACSAGGHGALVAHAGADDALLRVSTRLGPLPLPSGDATLEAGLGHLHQGRGAGQRGGQAGHGEHGGRLPCQVLMGAPGPIEAIAWWRDGRQLLVAAGASILLWVC
jgi:hypothetical protein